VSSQIDASDADDLGDSRGVPDRSSQSDAEARCNNVTSDDPIAAQLREALRLWSTGHDRRSLRRIFILMLAALDD